MPPLSRRPVAFVVVGVSRAVKDIHRDRHLGRNRGARAAWHGAVVARAAPILRAALIGAEAIVADADRA